MSQLNNGIPIDTETLRQLKAKRPVRKDKQYVFRLEASQVQRARELDLPDSALIALAAIDAAAFGMRRNDWVTLPPCTVDAFGRGFRWWHSATSKLEEAGLIECQRHAGRLPRYRLQKVGARSVSKGLTHHPHQERQ